MLGILLLLAVYVGGFIFGTWMVVWNVSDIIAVGPNFWNIFWILLVGAFVFGGAGKASS